MKKATEKISSIPKSFLLFLLASFFFWVLINLSKKYQSILQFPVKYTQLPQNKLLEEAPVKKIEMMVEGTGFKLLGLKFKKKPIVLDVNFLQQKNKNNYFLSLKDQQVKIQNQLDNNIKIIGFLEDPILLKIGSLANKKVPVELDASIKFNAGYNLSDKIELLPDSILISGSRRVLDTIKSLKTSKLTLENVNSSIEESAEIIIPENIQIKTEHHKILVKGKVDKFTEGNFSVSYRIKNVPKGIVMNTFPKKVKIIFKVGLSNFNQINESSFRVECDYLNSKENDLDYLIPVLTLKSSLVKSVKIVPNKIEYLIQE